MQNNSFLHITNTSMPKICVPIVACNEKDLLEEARLAYINSNVDIIEWRCDYMLGEKYNFDISNTLKKLKNILREKPLIFTLRTANEGGNYTCSSFEYEKILSLIIDTNICDFIDIELFSAVTFIDEIAKKIKTTHQKVIFSYHNFEKTPSEIEMLDILEQMVVLQADICKIAVMPSVPSDVVRLFSVSEIFREKYPNKALITISMAALGTVSRISGEFFNSCMTFGTLSESSAPGQLDVKDLKHILSILHANSKNPNNKM